MESTTSVAEAVASSTKNKALVESLKGKIESKVFYSDLKLRNLLDWH